MQRRKAEKIGCRYREYDLHARDGRQDKQAGQDKEKREGEGKRKRVETMEGRKAELEGPKFLLRINGNEAQHGGDYTWQTTVSPKSDRTNMRDNCARYFWQQDSGPQACRSMRTTDWTLGVRGPLLRIDGGKPRRMCEDKQHQNHQLLHF